jgi:hypothetical protein
MRVGFMTERRTVSSLAAVVLAAAAIVAAAGATGVASGRPDAPLIASGQPDAADPLVAGNDQVQAETYDLGMTRLPNFPADVEVAGVVHHPTWMVGRHLPLVVLLHGAHAYCLPGSNAVWPCPPGQSFPNYRGYDYVAGLLASHGYVVVSISANGVNSGGARVDDQGMTARAQLIDKHLDLFREWATRGDGPFGGRFLGAIDFSRVGTMGHSQGGEGFYQRWSAPGVAFAYVIGSCDHDTGPAGVKTYDDSRYAMPGDPGPKYMVYIKGANHNFFNTTWSPSGALDGEDDWQSVDPAASACEPGKPGRLTEARQRQIAAAYISSFFRYHLGGEKQFAPIWRGQVPLPPSFGPRQVQISYQAPAAQRVDVNRLLAAADLKRDALEGAVTLTGFQDAALCGGTPPEPHGCLTSSGDLDDIRQPHQDYTGPDSPTWHGLSVLKLGWSHRGAVFGNELTRPHRDLTALADLRFRAAVDFTDPRNPVDSPQDMSVTLTDGAGHAASVRVGRYSRALDYPQLQDIWAGNRQVRSFLMNQVTIPIGDFHGIDLRDVRSVELVFDATDHGSVGITDLALTR